MKQEVTFSFDQKDTKTTSSKGIISKEDAKYLIVTIENSFGVKVYDTKRLDLYNLNGSFISQSLSLDISDDPYHLTEFYVSDANNNIIYATPKVGSSLAYLVTNPLAIIFTVSKDITTRVVPETVSTKGTTAADFGLSSFDFNVVPTICLLMGVQIINPNIAYPNITLELATANISITGNPGNVALYSGSIAARIDTLRVKDGFDSYTISVSKDSLKWENQNSFSAIDTTFTKTELEHYLNKPLLFVLDHLYVGQEYQGGKIVYILHPADPGYNAEKLHGLIITPFDISTRAIFQSRVETDFLKNGTSTSLGTGMANTNIIVNSPGFGTLGDSQIPRAATLCSNLVLNGYSDWYLPSRDELYKYYINVRFVAGTDYWLYRGNNSSGYWSSSLGYGYNLAWCQWFQQGQANETSCSDAMNVRAFRSF